MSIIEQLLQHEFIKFNVKFDAGTEFFNKKIINLIEPFLQKFNIKYKKIDKQDIIKHKRTKNIPFISNKDNNNLKLILKLKIANEIFILRIMFY